MPEKKEPPTVNQLPPAPFRNKFGNQRRKMILLLCTGNTCRSPMAAGYLRHLIQKKEITNVEVRSAGVMTVTGLRASQEAAQVMADCQIDLSRHRSSQLSPEIIRKADLILGMSPLHVQTALRMSDEARNKTFLLKEYARSDLKNIQIADPMGCTLEVFKKVFKEIRSACERLSNMEIVTGLPDANPPERAARGKKPARKKQPAAVKDRNAAKVRENGTAKAAGSKTSGGKKSAAASGKASGKTASAKTASGKTASGKTSVGKSSKPAAKKSGSAGTTKKSARTGTTSAASVKRSGKTATGGVKKKTRTPAKPPASGTAKRAASRKITASRAAAKRKTAGAAGRVRK